MSGLGVMENVASEFEAIDTDFNGFITRDEMEDYVKKTGQDLRVVDVTVVQTNITITIL